MTVLPSMTLPEPKTRIGEYLWQWADETPHAEAAVLADTRLTYGGLAAQVERCAKALIACGVGKGDRVAMLSTSRPEFMVVLLAATEVGAIWVGLHPRYQMREFRYVVDQVRPRVLFALTEIDGRRYDEELAALRAEFDCIEHMVSVAGDAEEAVVFEEFLEFGDTAPSQLHDAQASVGPDDTAVIIFTSGTTGQPKGAMIKHYGLIRGALVEQARWPSRAGLRLLHNMPVNHIAGVGMMGLYPIIIGGTLVFQDRFDPLGVLEIIEKERVTFWLQAPTMFQLAVSHPKFDDFDLSSLEYVIWAGSAMPRDLVARLYDLDATLATAFGMTELTVYATYSDLDADFEVLAETIGRPEPAYEIRVADGNGVAVAVGQEGEIQARGRWLMNGYFNNPEATAEAFTPDGWFKTGDVALVRADGNLAIVGRTKEMYISGGYNIYPREIEIAIESHPDVIASAVIGTPDDVFGEVGHAFVQTAPEAGIGGEELDAWCRRQLANYKVPKTFEVMEELPRLAIGKIDKQTLAEHFRAQRPD